MPPAGMKTQRGRLRPATTRMTPAGTLGTLSRLSKKCGIDPMYSYHLDPFGEGFYQPFNSHLCQYWGWSTIHYVKCHKAIGLQACNVKQPAIHVNIGDGWLLMKLQLLNSHLTAIYVHLPLGITWLYHMISTWCLDPQRPPVAWIKAFRSFRLRRSSCVDQHQFRSTSWWPILVVLLKMLEIIIDHYGSL